jgi:ABC-2 type transport system permease protein
VVVLTRQRETLIGIVTMVTLPLTFLSSALIAACSRAVNWAVEAGRSAAAPNADCGLIATRAGFLALLLASGGDPAVREATASAAGLWRPQSRVSTR